MCRKDQIHIAYIIRKEKKKKKLVLREHKIRKTTYTRQNDNNEKNKRLDVPSVNWVIPDCFTVF